jgi:hypothetical protein
MVLPNENATFENMSIYDEMTIDERYKYLRKMQMRYRCLVLRIPIPTACSSPDTQSTRVS